MATKSPTPAHSFWGTFALAADLPNVAAAPTQDAALEVGDRAWVTGTSQLFGCTTPTLGAGVWTAVGPGGGGGAAIDTGNELWVDAVFGNDGTALVDRFDLPWLTIGAALGASASGDVVMVRPGTYAETGLTVPAGVSLIGQGGFDSTTVGSAAVAAHVLTLSDGAYLQGFSIKVPTTAAFAGVTHSVGTAVIYDLDFQGDGAAGAGDGVYKTGAGKIVGGNIRCSVGGATSLLRVDAAVLALDDVHVPQGPGPIANVIFTEGTGRFQGQGINVGNTNVVDVLHVAGTSTCIVYSPNFFNVPIGAHIAADGVSVTTVGGRIDATVASLFVDPALTGVGTSISVSGTTVQPLFSFPASAISVMDLNASFLQEVTATRNAESRVVGADFVTGFPELGSSLIAGRGSSYSDGIKAVTSDGTATSTTLGGNLTDVTPAAQSRSGSTVSFQGLTSNHCIYLASTRTVPAGTEMKHWGLFVTQLVASTGGSYAVETWDGAAWTAIGVMASSLVETYRYSNALFLRAASSEFLQYGIDDSTTWATLAVDGVTAYWVRIRIATTLTTGPTFEQMWLSPSHVMYSPIGRRRALGLAAWRKTLVSAGNVFGETGTVVSANFPVGTGAVPASWTHNSPNSLMNSNGDAMYAQFALPGGICTAFPLKINIVFSMLPGGTLSSPVIGFVSAIPVETAFNEVADPAGGLVPIPRTIATTETTIAKAATTHTFDSSLIGTVWPADTLYKADFGPYAIDSYYSEDVILVRLELDNDGTPNQDIAVIAMIIEGVVFADGGTL